jgi:hypothetical protein
MVHETYKSGLLAVRYYTSFVASFGTSVKIVVITDNVDAP